MIEKEKMEEARRIVGSIGGGCAEAAVLTEARLMIGSGRFKVFHVELTAESAEDEGMVCGGVMDCAY